MRALFRQNDSDEFLLANEHPQVLAAIEAEAVEIARTAKARNARDFARLAELAEEAADRARVIGAPHLEATGRSLAAIFRRTARQFGLN